MQISKFLKDSTAFDYGTQGLLIKTFYQNELIKGPAFHEQGCIKSCIYVETCQKNIEKKITSSQKPFQLNVANLSVK